MKDKKKEEIIPTTEEQLTIDDVDFDDFDFGEETTENPWDDYDFDIENEFRAFIEQKKEFIKIFDNLRKGNIEAKTGTQQATQDLIEEYHDILENLEKDKSRLIDTFSLGKITKEMQKHKKYPKAIGRHHTRKALGWFTGVGVGVSLLGLYYIGGTNPVTWTPLLIGACAGIGSLAGLGVSIPTRIRNFKKFDRSKVKQKKLNFIEKRIMKKVQQRERAFSNISLEIGENMLNILKGNYSISETTTIQRRQFFLFGKKKDYKKKKLREEYCQIPRRKRSQLVKAISEFEELNVKTNMLQDKLNNYISRKKRAEEERERTITSQQQAQQTQQAQVKTTKTESVTTQAPSQEAPKTRTVVAVKRVKNPTGTLITKNTTPKKR